MYRDFKLHAEYELYQEKMAQGMQQRLEWVEEHNTRLEHANDVLHKRLNEIEAAILSET